MWLRRLLALVLLGPPLLILVFSVVPVPVTPLMLIRAVQGHGIAHDWVSYDRIDPALARAVIASEDNTFCRQPLGFDFPALWEQITRAADGDRPRGASTITMQTAKNLFLWPGRDPVRKVVEAWLTPQVALLLSKKRVLEVYLNSVEFGPGIYGAEAAARHFFNRSAAELTQQQAAQLAVVLPNPLEWDAGRPSGYLQGRASTIRQRMQQLGPLLDCTE
ncbi:monofunctional biosynthetic peptidoglycan transglycosylase [Acetobacteraceae bacterium H6797]|nr:monofunctional biosynthetic peptidoglycan transglycosylase [Acetobacteraceae bacterium H6797]